MKTLVAASLILISTAAFANVDQCESTAQQSVPAAAKRPAPRIKHKVPVAPVVGPKLHLTPYVPVRPFAKSAPTKISTAFKYNCLTPISMPPGSVDIGGGIPFIGERPQWGNPGPSYLAAGPTPVWPGSPDDFRPTAYVPPGFVPPAPNELPEPPTVALMLLGVFLLMRKSTRLGSKTLFKRVD